MSGAANRESGRQAANGLRQGLLCGETTKYLPWVLPSLREVGMAEAYFYSDEVARFQVLLEEVTRAKPGSPQSRFVPPVGDVLDRLGSEFHHVLYGRRGTGKSSLLRRIEADRISRGHLVAWADQETYMEMAYPDVLVSTLADTFQQFAQQLRSAPAVDGALDWTRINKTQSKAVSPLRSATALQIRLGTRRRFAIRSTAQSPPQSISPPAPTRHSQSFDKHRYYSPQN